MAEIFNETYLYSPKHHQSFFGQELLNTQYTDWSEVCLKDIQNMIIPVINDAYIELLDDETLSDLYLFPMCDCQTQALYCIILRNQCDDPDL